MKLHALLLTLLAALAAGCTVPPPPPPRGRGGAKATASGEVRQPSDDELTELLRLAQGVVVARVEERAEHEGAVTYRLRVEQALLAASDGTTHPVVEGQELTTSDFLFRAGRGGGSIGALVELERYLFFLAPQQQPGAWLHLDDASAYPLPAARPVQERVEALLAERGAGKKKGAEDEARPEERRP